MYTSNMGMRIQHAQDLWGRIGGFLACKGYIWPAAESYLLCKGYLKC